MNTWAQALLFGHLSKETSELVAFGIAQGRAQVVLMLPGDATECLELALTRWREAQRVGPSVSGPGVAFNEPLLLEPVKQEH